MNEMVARCDWCRKPLTRKEYKKAEQNLICICEKCDKELDELIRGLKLGQPQ